jgi:hypothetical protein
MRRAILLTLALTLTASAHAQTRADLSALSFLLGDWDAISSAAGERGAFNFTLAIQDRVIVRTNYATYPAQDGKPATRHDDLMVIFVEDGVLKANYFDSEQHVIRYIIDARGPGDVVFVSEARAGEPRYRLSYTQAPNGQIKGSFEIAAPGAPDEFTPMFAWTARRLK